jgi:hypothetical protein
VAAHLRLELMPRGSSGLGQQARELTRNAATPRDKTAALYEYVARQVRYGRPVQETYDRLSRPIDKLAQDLRGDCKDKSALLLGLLRGASIPAHIAVINSRMQGETPYLPSGRFDHAIVVAGTGDNRVWLDPAGGTYTFGQVPYNDQGVHALILDEDKPRYEEVPRALPEQHGAHYECQARLDDAGAYSFKADVRFRGDRAAQWRLALLDRSEDYRARVVRQAVAHRLIGAEVGPVTISGVEDLKSDLAYSYTMTLPRYARRIEKLLLFRVPWSEPAAFEGPIAAAKRLTPLRTPLVQSVTEEHEIELPAGYTGYGLPQTWEAKCSWGSYQCSLSCEGGKLHCTRRLDIHGGMIAADSFNEVKRFFAECARGDEADVVLVREQI